MYIITQHKPEREKGETIKNTVRTQRSKCIETSRFEHLALAFLTIFRKKGKSHDLRITEDEETLKVLYL